MRLEKLNLINFRNYEEAELHFHERVNVFLGRNGSGKTNLLDAIYYLSFTKSAFSTSEQQIIRTGQNYFVVKGNFHLAGQPTREVVASAQSGAKKIFREDQRDYDKLSDHIGKYPVVIMTPDDTDLIREGSEYRRRFFDGIISQLDRRYLEDLMAYGHVLRQRNGLLKMSFETGRFDALALEAYDRLLIKYGEYLHSARKQFLKDFLPLFLSHFKGIVAEPEDPVISYASDLNESAFAEGLARSLSKDRALQRTCFGIHRDDYSFLLKGGEIRRTGSQGQQKSFVIALKLAQYYVIRQQKGFDPILLLDDIFDKLDDERINALVQLLRESDGQIFITDARPHRTSEILANIGVPGKTFHVAHGTVNSQQSS